ncbi:MAG TPA: HAMP domain-containing sensor histidine kinase [Gemmatimonadales bacterium]|nr:HAMP domain-containing sensor histidine kinase [Gemmatimonadales bacterium]
MATLRSKLALGYTVAMALAMVAFGAALIVVRRLPSREELDQRLARELDVIVSSLAESHRVLGRLTTADSIPFLAQSAVAPIDGVGDPVLVVGPEGQPLYLSQAARELDYRTIEQLLAVLKPPPLTRSGGTLPRQRAGDFRYMLAPTPGAGEEVTAVLVATASRAPTVEPSLLVQSMFVVAPFLLLGAVLLGYGLASTTVRPIMDMATELEEITDGRSLHRRLIEPLSADELAQLARTVNGMLARLEQSFGALHRFTADASHELKTPLMVVRVGVERALTNPATPAEAIEGLDHALGQLNHMAETVDNLLTLANADEGKASLAMAEADMRELLVEAAETAGILGEINQITVRTELTEAPVPLAVDRARIRQLLLNLVTNAIKYTPPGGKVSLGLVDKQDAVVVVVGDTGIGIKPNDLPHIFDRFWRADVSRDRTGERPGTGLGLAITKWIAEAHGGTISVHSRPGRGTVVTVTLPRRGASGVPTSTATGVTSGGAGSPG